MNQDNFRKKIGLAITGASGIVYGIRVLEELVRRNATVHLTISPNAKFIAKQEMGLDIDLETGHISGMDQSVFEWVIYHRYDHVGAAPASGSYGLSAVAVVPCSMGMLGRMATGVSDSLPCRMADVALKERYPLVLVPRETPYNAIQLQNMNTLSQAGAMILPASPGFYHAPKTIDDLVNFVVSRILHQLGFDAKDLVKGGWGEIHSSATQTHLMDGNVDS